MLEVLDTAGQEEYIALRDQWIRDGEGFVLVYSISSRSSFARIQRFHSQIQRVKDTAMAGSPTYPGSPMSASTPMFGQAPVMLVGNKCDRVTEREVSTQEGQALAKDLGCDFVEASAKNCVNVEKAFFDVVRQLRRQRNQGSGRSSTNKGEPHALARTRRTAPKQQPTAVVEGVGTTLADEPRTSQSVSYSSELQQHSFCHLHIWITLLDEP
jgi:GTPase KRas protein